MTRGRWLIRFAATKEGREAGEVFDTQLATWREISSKGAPQYIQGHQISSPRYIAAGRGAFILWTNAGQVVGSYFDPVDNTWSTTEAADFPKSSIGLLTHPTSSGFVVATGSDLGSLLHFNAPTMHWSKISADDVPTINHRNKSLFVGDSLIVWNGSDARHRLSIRGGSWKQMTTKGQPTPRWAGFAGGYTDTLFVWGGIAKGGKWLNSADQVHDGGIYDLSSDSWRDLSGTHPPVLNHANAALSFEQVGAYFIASLGDSGKGNRRLHYVDSTTAAWRAVEVGAAGGTPIALGDSHVLLTDTRRATVVDLAAGTSCESPLSSIPFLRGASDITGVDVHSVANGVLLWGRTDFACPSCPPGAPCVPCQPPTAPDRSDGVFLVLGD